MFSERGQTFSTAFIGVGYKATSSFRDGQKAFPSPKRPLLLVRLASRRLSFCLSFFVRRHQRKERHSESPAEIGKAFYFYFFVFYDDDDDERPKSKRVSSVVVAVIKAFFETAEAFFCDDFDCERQIDEGQQLRKALSKLLLRRRKRDRSSSNGAAAAVAF